MLYFAYSAYNGAGVADHGYISAETLADAKLLLDIKGLKPFALTQRRNIPSSRRAPSARVSLSLEGMPP